MAGLCALLSAFLVYSHSFTQWKRQLVHLLNGKENSFIYSMERTTHSFTQWKGQLICLLNGKDNSFICSMERTTHSFAQWKGQLIHLLSGKDNSFIYSMERTTHLLTQWKGQLIHLLNEKDNSFICTMNVNMIECTWCHWAKTVTIHQLTTVLSTSKNVLFPCHNHLLTTGTDNIDKVKGHQHRWLAGGYDLEIGHF